MIKRIPGESPTRSRATVHDGRVYAVATSRIEHPTLYAQTRDTLGALDEALALAGTSKSRILTATVYITDMKQKPEMNRAWDEWVDRASPPQRACVCVTLEEGDLVEIVVVAAV
jgi:enamine deaminase RidA (YjgF/YER057c/UK114 family)